MYVFIIFVILTSNVRRVLPLVVVRYSVLIPLVVSPLFKLWFNYEQLQYWYSAGESSGYRRILPIRQSVSFDMTTLSSGRVPGLAYSILIREYSEYTYSR
jgi:hypothetical protein